MAGKKKGGKDDKKAKAVSEKKARPVVKMSPEQLQKFDAAEAKLKQRASTTSNPIFKMFFRSGHIPGTVYDAPSSQIYRAQTALRNLLGEYKPSSEVVFGDVHRPPPEGPVRLEGRCVWLGNDEDAQHWSKYDGNERIGGGAGFRRKQRFEAMVKDHMARVASIVKKFK